MWGRIEKADSAFSLKIRDIKEKFKQIELMSLCHEYVIIYQVGHIILPVGVNRENLSCFI